MGLKQPAAEGSLHFPNGKIPPKVSEYLHLKRYQ